jgi:hypothetical protein
MNGLFGSIPLERGYARHNAGVRAQGEIGPNSPLSQVGGGPSRLPESPAYRGREVTIGDIRAALDGQARMGRISPEEKERLYAEGVEFLRRFGPYGSGVSSDNDSGLNQTIVDEYLAAVGDGDVRAAREITQAYLTPGGARAMNARIAGGNEVRRSSFGERGQRHPANRVNPALFGESVPPDTPLSDPNYAPAYRDPRHPKYTR